MPFVPNAATAAVPRQAGLTAADLDILAAGSAQTGVASGCLVEANGMGLALTVAAGVVYHRGARVAFPGGSVTAVPDPALPRRALVTVAVGGTVAITHGAPALAPLLPSVEALPANSVVVGAVDVEAGATAIALPQVSPGKRVAVLDPPGGPAPTVTLQGAHVVTGDGTNQTAHLRAALVAARDHATIKTVRIRGTVLIDPTLDTVGDFAGTVLYAGCTLEGTGYSSVLRFWSDAPVDGNDYYGVRYRGNATIRNLRIDGNRAAFATKGAAWVNHGQIGLYGSVEAVPTGVTIDTVWIHDIYSKGSEGFGWLATPGETGARVRGCRAWGIDGTGLSPSGLVAGPRVTDVEVADCSAWNNRWNGFSVFACDGARLLDCRAWDNDQGGFNAEWSTGMDVIGGLAYGNGLGGLTTYGDVTVRLHACRFEGNSTAVSSNNGNEVMTQKGYANGTEEIGRLVEVRDCAIFPPAGRAHVWYQTDAALARPRPTVRLIGPDVAGWTVQNINSDAHTTVERLAPRRPATGGVASVADGGTIPHGLGGVPLRYGATATVAGRSVAVTAASATTLTVALKAANGVAVTVAEPVAWWAEE